MTIYVINKPLVGTIIRGNLAKEKEPHFYIALNEPFDYVTTSKLNEGKVVKDGVLLVNFSEAYNKDYHLVLTKKDHKLIIKDSFVVFDKAVIYSIDDLNKAFNSRHHYLNVKQKVSKELLGKIRAKFLSSNASDENKIYLQKYLEQNADKENKPVLRN